MKAMPCQQNTYNRSISIDGFNSNIELVNALNDLYLCFRDEHDFTNAHSDHFD